jgi:hypothetical protein
MADGVRRTGYCDRSRGATRLLRVTRVLSEIRGSDELRISLEDAAEMAFLSPSRFAHLNEHHSGALPGSHWRL